MAFWGQSAHAEIHVLLFDRNSLACHRGCHVHAWVFHSAAGTFPSSRRGAHPSLHRRRGQKLGGSQRDWDGGWFRAGARRALAPSEHHRDYIETKHLRKAVVLTDSDCDAFHAGFKKCCDVTDAHDPSVGRNGLPPTPSEVLKDIQDLADWTASLRSRQKLIN